MATFNINIEKEITPPTPSFFTGIARLGPPNGVNALPDPCDELGSDYIVPVFFDLPLQVGTQLYQDINKTINMVGYSEPFRFVNATSGTVTFSTSITSPYWFTVNAQGAINNITSCGNGN